MSPFRSPSAVSGAVRFQGLMDMNTYGHVA